MLSGAGEGVSRWRWALSPTLLTPVIFVLLFRCSTCCIPVRLFWTIEGKRPRRTLRRRRAWQLLVIVLLITFPLRLVLFLAMCREDSLTTALFRFTGTFPDESTSGCRGTSHAVDSVQASQPPLELSFQPSRSLSPIPRRLEPIISLWFAPLQSAGTSFPCFTSVDPIFIGNSSLSPTLKVKIYYMSQILFNDCAVPHQRYFYRGLFYVAEVQFRSGASPFPRAKSGLTVSFCWAWPMFIAILVSPSLIQPMPRFIETNAFMALLVLDDSEISGGFTGISSCCLLPYFSCGMNLPVGSLGLVSNLPSFSVEKCRLPPFLLSLKGDAFLVLLPSNSFSLLTGLPSCVAVCTGPEDAIEITSVFLVGESCFSTSPLYVTISQLSDLVVKALTTHSNFVLISLSSSHEELSFFTYCVSVVYLFN